MDRHQGEGNDEKLMGVGGMRKELIYLRKSSISEGEKSMPSMACDWICNDSSIFEIKCQRCVDIGPMEIFKGK